MKPFLDPNVVKPFLDPNVAHPAKFVDLHRIESSAELAELTRRHQREGGCCAAPTLLLWTNLPCLLAGALHLFHQRLVPGIIFVLLALASCVRTKICLLATFARSQKSVRCFTTRSISVSFRRCFGLAPTVLWRTRA
jgi:hypothetical protein